MHKRYAQLNNMSWINSQIAVSGAFTDQDIFRLKKEGVDAIVDLRSEKADKEDLLKKHGMDYLRVKIDDTFSPSFDQLKSVMDFVGPLLDKGRRVLIHCQNGAGRSPLIAVTVLAWQGMKPVDAMRLIKHKHPKTGFTEEQQYFLDNELDKFLKAHKKK